MLETPTVTISSQPPPVIVPIFHPIFPPSVDLIVNNNNIEADINNKSQIEDKNIHQRNKDSNEREHEIDDDMEVDKQILQQTAIQKNHQKSQLSVSVPTRPPMNMNKQQSQRPPVGNNITQTKSKHVVNATPINKHKLTIDTNLKRQPLQLQQSRSIQV